MQPKFILTDALSHLEEERIDLQKKNSKILPYLILGPIVTLGLLAFFGAPVPMIFFTTIISAAISLAGHYWHIGSEFKKIKAASRELLIGEFMSRYYPDIKHRYRIDSNTGSKIIKNSGLISANIFNEEDVLTGETKNAIFYLSEIIAQRSSGKSTVKVFDGMLFRIRLKGRSFPKSKIYKKHRMNLFHAHKKDRKLGFYYNTSDEAAFRESLAPLFPFIQHLMKESNDLRIATQGDEIVILMGSKVKFLDDPKPRLNETLINDQYFENMGKQLHSFLYIIQAFADNLATDEIADTLEKLVLRDPKQVRSQRHYESGGIDEDELRLER